MAHEYGEAYQQRFRDPLTGGVLEEGEILQAYPDGDAPLPALFGHNGGPGLDGEEEETEAPLMEPISQDDLESWLHERISDAVNYDNDETSRERQESLNYYLGRPYGDERAGYSKVVTRDVFEIVEWALASLVRIFLSAPRIVEFKPVSGDDVKQAAQETAVVQSVLDGCFIQLMFWVRDALMYPNAYLKVWHEDIPKRTKQRYQGLTEAQVGMLTQNPDIELLSATPRQGWPGGPAVYDVEVSHSRTEGKIRVQAVPPEEVLVLTENPEHLSLDELDYAHYRQVPRWELVEMGYDPEWVRELPVSIEYATNDERSNRQPDKQEDLNDQTLEMMELVDYYECFVTIDMDGDGFSERRRICAVGGMGSTVEVVENEEDDFSGMCTLSAVPQSHRHVGVSLAESMKWVQRVSSTLTRQLLDNLYRTNRPRTFAGPGTNLEQLENYVPHGVVEVSSVDNVREEVVSTVVDKVLPVLQHFDQEKEASSGVSRHTMGLDAERLQETTMGAYVNALGQASQRLELFARTFAETGFAELSKKIHRLIRMHQDIPNVFRLRGEWTEVDPETWRDERDTVPCVGLGYGTSQERIAAGMALLDVQKEGVQHGLSTLDRVYRNLEDIVYAMGKRDPSMYFVDPNSEEGKKVQARIQQAKQREQQMGQELAQQALAEESKKTTVKLTELRQRMQEHIDEELRKWAELELEHEVDIADRGIEQQKLTKMAQGGPSNG